MDAATPADRRSLRRRQVRLEEVRERDSEAGEDLASFEVVLQGQEVALVSRAVDDDGSSVRIHHPYEAGSRGQVIENLLPNLDRRIRWRENLDGEIRRPGPETFRN